MILADKITDLRKKNGWSQEELAGKLGVSRQSVSKWESAASIPDLDKIMKLSELFGVSTDYLLKDSIEPKENEIEVSDSLMDEKVRVITLEEANTYLDLVRNIAGKIALGVALCILSPAALICLAGLSDEEGGFVIPEAAAIGTGMTILLLMVAVAVALFIYYGRKLDAYDFLEKEPIELTYGVTGAVEKHKSKYESAHSVSLVTGVALCILSAVPIMVTAAFDNGGMAVIIGVDLCLALVALGVFFLVRTLCVFEAFQKLLEEGDYSRKKKIENEKNDALSTVYWCVITAVYLGWSFYTMEWHRTWIIWPCAAVLFGAVAGISALIRRK